MGAWVSVFDSGPAVMWPRCKPGSPSMPCIGPASRDPADSFHSAPSQRCPVAGSPDKPNASGCHIMFRPQSACTGCVMTQTRPGGRGPCGWEKCKRKFSCGPAGSTSSLMLDPFCGWPGSWLPEASWSCASFSCCKSGMICRILRSGSSCSPSQANKGALCSVLWLSQPCCLPEPDLHLLQLPV